MSNVLKFTPFNRSIDPSFWHKFSQIKLDVDRLEEKPRNIWGFYSCFNLSENSSVISVDYSSFNTEYESRKMTFPAYGVLLNKNTVEDFKDCDKNKLLEEHGRKVWEDIISGAALENPSLLVRFLILAHADLKKYVFYFWFAFPAAKLVPVTLSQSPCKISDIFTDKQIDELDNLIMQNTTSHFLVDLDGDKVSVRQLSLLKSKPIQYIAFFNPCESILNPGWPLRNLLALLAHYCPEQVGSDIQVLCLRQGVSISVCYVLTFPLPPLCETLGQEPQWVGWDRNKRGKFGPDKVNLNSQMNPKILAESAVFLNLKLMKWRLAPDIDLDLIRKTKCLLLGAGTLGCVVSRTLVGWGVQDITLVDNSRVAYSNPARQWLYTFNDCGNGGKPKAQAAADMLQAICPSVNVVAEELTIPMPGHAVGGGEVAEVESTVAKLEDLIKNADVIFLLLDSREGRWLPTLLGAVHGKLVINAALGFDTYLVMRHGVNSGSGDVNSDVKLGCYFCNDVTAPGNSIRNRSLDQKCTVTRPGIAAVAGALAVELMVSTLQHPLRGDAPADSTDERSPLGIVPHSVRGFLSRFAQITTTSHKFSCCVACSEKVISEFNSRRMDFLIQVFNTSDYLEDLTGLSQLKQETEDAEVLELSDSDLE